MRCGIISVVNPGIDSNHVENHLEAQDNKLVISF